MKLGMLCVYDACLFYRVSERWIRSIMLKTCSWVVNTVSTLLGCPCALYVGCCDGNSYTFAYCFLHFPHYITLRCLFAATLHSILRWHAVGNDAFAGWVKKEFDVSPLPNVFFFQGSFLTAASEAAYSLMCLLPSVLLSRWIDVDPHYCSTAAIRMASFSWGRSLLCSLCTPVSEWNTAKAWKSSKKKFKNEKLHFIFGITVVLIFSRLKQRWLFDCPQIPQYSHLLSAAGNNIPCSLLLHNLCAPL